MNKIVTSILRTYPARNLSIRAIFICWFSPSNWTSSYFQRIYWP